MFLEAFGSTVLLALLLHKCDEMHLKSAVVVGHLVQHPSQLLVLGIHTFKLHLQLRHLNQKPPKLTKTE